MLKILRVNMTDKTTRIEDAPKSYLEKGGRGLIAQILLDEVNPTCEPLGKNNKLIFATGFLTGTMVSSANRVCIGGKSPLTGGIKESNAGGVNAARIAQMDIKAIIIEGFPQGDQDDKWYYLKIDKNGCSLEPADEYVGMGNYEFAKKITEKHPNAAVSCIGPAGERQYKSAGIATTDPEGRPSRFSARGGLGAVMGSKKIKAVVVTEKDKVSIADEDKFKETNKKLSKIISEAPSSHAYRTLGTPGMMKRCNSLGGVPVNNFSVGEFDRVEKVSGEKLYSTIGERSKEEDNSHRCMPGCVIRCSNIYPDKEGNEIVAPLEYETIALMGPNLGIDDFDTIAKLNYICNDLGLDTIEIGVALGVAMEGGQGEFGDEKAVFKLLDEIKNDTVLGKVLANGAYITGQVFNVLNIPHVKKQAMAAYEPRAIKGMGVTYATSPMGADHTYGPTARAEIDHSSPEGQVEESRKMQKYISIFDSSGFCYFVMGAVIPHLELVAELINARFGWNIDVSWLENMGMESMKKEREFNKLAGFTKVDDRLPESFTERELPNLKTTFDVKEEDMDNIFDFE